MSSYEGAAAGSTMSSYEGDVGEEAADDGGEPEHDDVGESDAVLGLEFTAESRVVPAFMGNGVE